MAGRKPIPTALKILRGNPGQHPLNKDEPEPAPQLPEPPDDLGAYALAEYQERGPILLRLGLMTENDVPTFQGYCREWGRYRDAEDALNREGTIIRAPSGYPLQNPQFIISHKALSKCLDFWREFGMTPAARTRIKVAKPAASASAKPTLGSFMKKAAR